MSRKWLGLAGLAVAVGAVCARLGFWQLDRLEERRAANVALIAAREAPMLDLGPGSYGVEHAGRRARAIGRYDRSREMVIRGATFEGSPGVRVITPLEFAFTDTVLLVDRGFMPAADAVTADLSGLDEPGVHQVRGVLEPLGETSRGRPLERGGVMTWQRLDLASIRATIPYPVAPLLLRQLPDSTLPARPVRLEPPALDEGSHRAYAIQWFAFALVAVGGAVAALWTDRRTDRRTDGPTD